MDIVSAVLSNFLGNGWAAVTTIVLSTSFVTTLLTMGVGAARDRKRVKLASAYLALRVATLLEVFALKCWKYVDDNEQYWNSGLESLMRVGIPHMPPYPDDPEAWRGFPLELSERLLTLVNLTEIDRLDLELWEELTEDKDSGSDEQATDDTDAACIARGCEALTLAAELRSRYGFPAFKPHDGFTDKLLAMRKPA